MKTQQHLNRLFGEVPSQLLLEVEALRNLWFQLKGRDGSLRKPGTLAGEWVAYSVSAVAGTPLFRFFFRHAPGLTPDITPIKNVFARFPFKTEIKFGVTFSALTRDRAPRYKSSKSEMPTVMPEMLPTAFTVTPEMLPTAPTVTPGMLLTITTTTGEVVDGTLCAFLTEDKSASTQNIWLLSVNHVLAANGSSSRADTIEIVDSGSLTPFFTQPSRFTLLRSDCPNFADVAIVQLNPGYGLWADPTFLTPVSKVPPGYVPPGSTVTRKGVGSHAHQDVNGSNIDLALELEYDSGNCKIPNATMEDQYLVEGDGVDFADSGDSGSPVLYQDFLFGMVIADSETVEEVPETYTVVTPFEDLMYCLNHNLNLDSGEVQVGPFSLYQGPPVAIP